MPGHKIKILRIIDANYNRLRDGIRVIEDTLRFYYDSPDYLLLRDLRASVLRMVSKTYPSLVTARSSGSDIGRASTQKKHKNVEALLRANFSRCSEALRVLEEYSRLVSPSKCAGIKKIRFRLYELEKKVATKFLVNKCP